MVGGYGRGDLADLLRARAHRFGDKPALIAATEVVSYADLDARVDRVAAGFQRVGLEAGDRVALILGNTTVFVTALFGAWRAGMTVVPMDVAGTAAEAAQVLADSGAKAVVAVPGEVTGALPLRCPELEHIVVVGDAVVGGPAGATMTWTDLADTEGVPAAVPAADPALLLYTAGTTGRPKGAMLTQDNLLANHAQMSGTRLAVDEDDVVLGVLPLFHVYGLNVALMFTLARGASLLLVERFRPRETLAAIAAHRVSVVVGAPPMYAAWLYAEDLPVKDFTSVRIAVSGAAPLPAAVFERFRHRFGVTVWDGYGLTEAAPVLTSTAMDDTVRPGSVGRPLPGVELRLVDVHGGPVAQGDPGEVLARGPNVFRGYWNDPDATAAALDADGWLHTGDIGYADHGALHLVDRRGDMVIVSGFNVYPREVEDVLRAHPAVRDAAVVGVPHPITGEEVKAVVVLHDGAEADAEQLRAYCRTRLARFKCPATVVFASELPYLAGGKVSRRRLRPDGPAGAAR